MNRRTFLATAATSAAGAVAMPLLAKLPAETPAPAPAQDITLTFTETPSHLLFPACTTHYLIAIFGPDSKPLAHIACDGRVTTFGPRANEDAAKVFWDCIQFNGMSTIARIRHLEERLAKYEVVEPFSL